MNHDNEEITWLIQKLNEFYVFTLQSVVYEDENGAHNVLSEAEQWFTDRDISLHSLNSNSESEARFHKSRKVYADIYIDNNGLGIPKYSDGELNWYEIEKLLDMQGCFNRQLSLGIWQ